MLNDYVQLFGQFDAILTALRYDWNALCNGYERSAQNETLTTPAESLEALLINAQQFGKLLVSRIVQQLFECIEKDFLVVVAAGACTLQPFLRGGKANWKKRIKSQSV